MRLYRTAPWPLVVAQGRLLREVVYRLTKRSSLTPSQLPFQIVAAHPGLVVETRVAHLDERGRVWRLLDVTGPRQALEAARAVFDSYRGPHLVEKELLGQSGSRLICWYKYRPPKKDRGFSHTALAFARLGRETLLTDRTEADALTIRILTAAAAKIPEFLRQVQAASGPDFAYELLYLGPPRETRSPGLSAQEERLLRTAQELGFFGVPRRSQMRDLAKRLGISPSAVSYQLRKIESKLVLAYLGR